MEKITVASLVPILPIQARCYIFSSGITLVGQMLCCFPSCACPSLPSTRIQRGKRGPRLVVCRQPCAYAKQLVSLNIPSFAADAARKNCILTEIRLPDIPLHAQWQVPFCCAAGRRLPTACTLCMQALLSTSPTLVDELRQLRFSDEFACMLCKDLVCMHVNVGGSAIFGGLVRRAKMRTHVPKPIWICF